MGYSHYWEPSGPIDSKIFPKIYNDFNKLCEAEKERIHDIIRGPLGDGNPIISETIISFNGNRNCAHANEKSVLFHVPGEEGKITFGKTGYRIESSSKRTCSAGRCSCETMTLFSNKNKDSMKLWGAEPDWFNGSVKTNYKPYDIAVQCLLLIVSRHILSFRIQSDGNDDTWFDAKLLCQMNLGYGLNFKIL